jgi:hypothetical protein
MQIGANWSIRELIRASGDKDSKLNLMGINGI